MKSVDFDYRKNKPLFRKDVIQYFWSSLKEAILYVDFRQRVLKDKLLQKTLIHKGLEVVGFFKENLVNIKAYPQ